MQIHGSYYALEGGAVHEALVDLTGGVGFKVKLDQLPPNVVRAMGQGPPGSNGSRHDAHQQSAADAHDSEDEEEEEEHLMLGAGQYHQGYDVQGAAEALAQRSAVLGEYLSARDAKLWGELQGWLASGSIVAISAKVGFMRTHLSGTPYMPAQACMHMIHDKKLVSACRVCVFLCIIQAAYGTEAVFLTVHGVPNKERYLSTTGRRCMLSMAQALGRERACRKHITHWP